MHDTDVAASLPMEGGISPSAECAKEVEISLPSAECAPPVLLAVFAAPLPKSLPSPQIAAPPSALVVVAPAAVAGRRRRVRRRPRLALLVDTTALTDAMVSPPESDPSRMTTTLSTARTRPDRVRRTRRRAADVVDAPREATTLVTAEAIFVSSDRGTRRD